MGGEQERWFGPGETARRLGVTTKALRVYEREGLLAPRRAQSGWRLYGPAELARLHQIIVLRDLGLPLKSIRTLVGDRSRLEDVLRLQRESLRSQHAKIARALELIEAAQRRLDEGRDLSLDDLATLTKETLVQQPTQEMKAFAARFKALVADRDPSGDASRALEALKADASPLRDAPETEALIAEAARLKASGDTQSEAAKALVRRLRALMSPNVRRPGPAQLQVLRDAYAEVVAEVTPLPFEPATLAFIREVAQGMKARGELD